MRLSRFLTYDTWHTRLKRLTMRHKQLLASIRSLPRNIWAVSATSFLMDVSSEMVLNILPLFLASVLGVQTTFIGLIEGVAESMASLLRVGSGWLSDPLKSRTWLAVAGYGLSTLVKPVFYFAGSWGGGRCALGGPRRKRDPRRAMPW